MYVYFFVMKYLIFTLSFPNPITAHAESSWNLFRFFDDDKSYNRPSSDGLVGNLIRFRNEFTTPPPKVALIGQTWSNVPEDEQIISPSVNNLNRQNKEPSGPSVFVCERPPGVDSIGLKIHNLFRQKHSTEPLQLSNQLSERAQACASYYCDRSESAFHTCHYRSEIDAGENIYQVRSPQDSLVSSSSSSSRATGPQIIANGLLDWYQEIRFYDFQNPACSPLNPASLHFTQMMWRSARFIGIGLCSCSQESKSNNHQINNEINNNKFYNKTVFVTLYDTLQRNGSLRRRCSSVRANVLPPTSLNFTLRFR